jgi:tetratricopeptide (TPR) repeat protein
MDDHVRQMLVLGREHYSKQEYDLAEQLLVQVLRTDDRLADVHDMLGVIAHNGKRYADAEKHFERALELNPNYTEAAMNLAVTYNDRGKFEEARAIYSKIKQRPTGDAPALDPFARGKIANMHAQLAEAYNDASMTRAAVAEYEKAVLLCPDFVDIRTKLATLLRQAGELVRARDHYEVAVRTRPSYLPARILLGVTLLALGDVDAAEGQWNAALEVDPSSVSAKMYLRMAKLQRSRQSAPPGRASEAPPTPDGSSAG